MLVVDSLLTICFLTLQQPVLALVYLRSSYSVCLQVRHKKWIYQAPGLKRNLLQHHPRQHNHKAQM